MALFDQVPKQRPPGLPAAAHLAAARAVGPDQLREDFQPGVDERVMEVYNRARDANDPFELRDLWLGRIECELDGRGHRPQLAARWRATRNRRTVHPDEILSSRATVRFVKELFNFFFRDDVYGDLRPSAEYILSGGSVDEQVWGLPETLKNCIRFALERDWYGYSDSRGRIPVREAVAEYENARIDTAPYDARRVALTMGGTFAISSLVDFILLGGGSSSSAVVCGIPNYPPLVEAISRRRATRLVPLPSRSGYTNVDGLIAALTADTPLVMLQTAVNPTGAGVREDDLARLIRAASPTTIILLDECHEWLGPVQRLSPARAAPNVVRVSSLSKTWSVPGLKVGWILADAALIDMYYEHASTTFGGPPSFLYTVVEVLARMERWRITGMAEPGVAELAEFEDSYELQLGPLQAAYRAYQYDRTTREHELTVLRDAATVGLSEASASVIPPRYSINLAVEFPGWTDSYRCFRHLLQETGVVVYPGILTFCLSGGIVRITAARRWSELGPAMARLRSASAGAAAAVAATAPPSVLREAAG